MRAKAGATGDEMHRQELRRRKRVDPVWRKGKAASCVWLSGSKVRSACRAISPGCRLESSRSRLRLRHGERGIGTALGRRLTASRGVHPFLDFISVRTSSHLSKARLARFAWPRRRENNEILSAPVTPRASPEQASEMVGPESRFVEGPRRCCAGRRVAFGAMVKASGGVVGR